MMPGYPNLQGRSGKLLEFVNRLFQISISNLFFYRVSNMQSQNNVDVAFPTPPPPKKKCCHIIRTLIDVQISALCFYFVYERNPTNLDSGPYCYYSTRPLRYESCDIPGKSSTCCCYIKCIHKL